MDHYMHAHAQPNFVQATDYNNNNVGVGRITNQPELFRYTGLYSPPSTCVHGHLDELQCSTCLSQRQVAANPGNFTVNNGIEASALAAGNMLSGGGVRMRPGNGTPTVAQLVHDHNNQVLQGIIHDNHHAGQNVGVGGRPGNGNPTVAQLVHDHNHNQVLQAIIHDNHHAGGQSVGVDGQPVQVGSASRINFGLPISNIILTDPNNHFGNANGNSFTHVIPPEMRNINLNRLSSQLGASSGAGPVSGPGMPLSTPRRTFTIHSDEGIFKLHDISPPDPSFNYGRHSAPTTGAGAAAAAATGSSGATTNPTPTAMQPETDRWLIGRNGTRIHIQNWPTAVPTMKEPVKIAPTTIELKSPEEKIQNTDESENGDVTEPVAEILEKLELKDEKAEGEFVLVPDRMEGQVEQLTYMLNRTLATVSSFEKQFRRIHKDLNEMQRQIKHQKNEQKQTE